ncbi:MAG: hypothetical protein ACI4T1_00750 [Christensenellales bacterium]
MKKFLSYKFLMTVLASIIVFIEILSGVFNFNINIDAIVSIGASVVGILVALNIVVKTKEDKDIKTKEDLKELIETKDDNELN